MKREQVTNTSGVVPLGHAVLLVTQEVRKGVIEIPEAVRARMIMSEQRAQVVEIGSEAWKEEGKRRCEVGDQIVFSKFAGYEVPGKDGKMYRVVNDRDIFLKEVGDE